MFTVGFQYDFIRRTTSFSNERNKQQVVNDMLLFWCFWFKYKFIKYRLVLGSVVNSVNVNSSARVECKPRLA